MIAARWADAKVGRPGNTARAQDNEIVTVTKASKTLGVGGRGIYHAKNVFENGTPGLVRPHAGHSMADMGGAGLDARLTQVDRGEPRRTSILSSRRLSRPLRARRLGCDQVGHGADLQALVQGQDPGQDQLARLAAHDGRA